MRNPVILRKRYTRRRSRPIKTRLLSNIVTYIGSYEIVHNSVLGRKALKQIVADDEMWKRNLLNME